MLLRSALSPFTLGRWLVWHSLFWLVLANLVGLILSILLSFPEIGDLISPLTYGKWVPLHLNFHLYGWCSLPVIGLLLRWYLPRSCWTESSISLTLEVWSGALLYGGLSWLAGETSGKIFLDWKGSSEIMFLIALTLLWIQLALGLGVQLNKANGQYQKWSFLSTRTFGLVLLAAVPIVFFWALNPEIFPPINLSTSGATGASLLVSSLAIVLLFLVLPIILEVKTKTSPAALWLFVALGIHFLLWSIIPHRNSTHREIGQIIAVASLLVWAPALWWYFQQFCWSAESKYWRLSTGLFGLLLVITAVIMFLPGILDQVKFSQYLVAHVHLAMGGMVSSFLFVILIELPVDVDVKQKLSRGFTILMWHAGICMQLVTLLELGSLELKNFGVSRSAGGSEFVWQLLRLAGGGVMTYCSLTWLISCSRLEDRTECLDLNQKALKVNPG